MGGTKAMMDEVAARMELPDPNDPIFQHLQPMFTPEDIS